MLMINLKIKKLHPDAKIPHYAHPHDAGMDLFAIEHVIVPAGGRALIGTGIAMEIPEKYVGLVWDKSGLSNSHGLKTLGGVIDAGYRGEIKVGLVNLGQEDCVIGAGHKIAQMLIQKVKHAEITLVDDLSPSGRGENGFGSTGK